MQNEVFIRRCLELAERGRGRVGNGAMVGAVLVRSGKVLAEAFHEGFGKGHAERRLLQEFERSIEPGDVLYVNLEPCCHHGKTPPCTSIILECGIRTVVFGMRDPDSRVSGKGIRLLHEKGVEVIGPVLPELCERFNRGFVSVRKHGRPFVTLKRAQTKNGAIAKPDGNPLKITSAKQDRWSHQWLRAKHDAVLVGVETICTDNPVLTVRCIHPIPNPLTLTLSRRERDNGEQPWRIVLDPHLRIPLNAKVVSDGGRGRTVIVKDSNETNETKETKDILKGRGVRVLEVALDSKGKFVWGELWKVLLEPSGDFHGITSVLVEGGRRTWEVFREAGVVDEEVVLVSRE